MNIQTVATNLRATIAGKENMLLAVQQERTFVGLRDGEDIALKTTAQFLKVNIDELKRILQDVEQCEPSLPGEGNNDSWITNPDRSGGQFTDEEINRAGEWR
jgi:hypothetical protein